MAVAPGTIGRIDPERTRGIIITVELDEAQRRGEAAELDFRQLYEVRQRIESGQPVPSAHRRTWELLTDAQRAIVLDYGATWETERAEHRRDVEPLLRGLGLERPCGRRVGRWRTSEHEAPVAHSRSRRGVRGSGSPPTPVVTSASDEARVTITPSGSRSGRLYDAHAEGIMFARSALEWCVLVAELERAQGQTPEPRVVVIETRDAQVRLPVEAIRKSKHEPSGFRQAAGMKLAGSSLREIQAETGIPRSALGRILDSV